MIIQDYINAKYSYPIVIEDKNVSFIFKAYNFVASKLNMDTLNELKIISSFSKPCEIVPVGNKNHFILDTNFFIDFANFNLYNIYSSDYNQVFLLLNKVLSEKYIVEGDEYLAMCFDALIEITALNLYEQNNFIDYDEEVIEFYTKSQIVFSIVHELAHLYKDKFYFINANQFLLNEDECIDYFEEIISDYSGFFSLRNNKIAREIKKSLKNTDFIEECLCDLTACYFMYFYSDEIVDLFQDSYSAFQSHCINYANDFIRNNLSADIPINFLTPELNVFSLLKSSLLAHNNLLIMDYFKNQNLQEINEPSLVKIFTRMIMTLYFSSSINENLHEDNPNRMYDIFFQFKNINKNIIDLYIKVLPNIQKTHIRLNSEIKENMVNSFNEKNWPYKNTIESIINKNQIDFKRFKEIFQ